MALALAKKKKSDEVDMIVYLAGNFDFLIYYDKENEALKHITDLGLDYNRLVSFFEAHRTNSILKIKKEWKNERKSRLRKRRKSS